MVTLIKNVRFAGQSCPDGFILIQDERIAQAGNGPLPDHDASSVAIIDGKGALAMPGVIDCHVHFREPGLTHKADILSESRAAVAGGVTSYFDMPNTKPQTTTLEAWKEKCQLAQGRSYANYAFFIGATNDNIDTLVQAPFDKIPGVKLFMGSSTGNMLVDNQDQIKQLFSCVPLNVPISVHAEDQNIIDRNTAQIKSEFPDGKVPLQMHSVVRSNEACLLSSQHAVELARLTGHKLNLCHISTAQELEFATQAPVQDKLVTIEVSPHHLMWCDQDYARKGALIKMNPAVKAAADRDALRQAVEDGLVDIIATDHAPHQLSEKEGDAFTAVSGAPLVQYSLPWMLTHFDEDRVQQLMCINPALRFGVQRRGELKPGYFADIVLVQKLAHPAPIPLDSCLSKCGWAPAIGEDVSYQVSHTWVNGALVYENGAVLSSPPPGKPISFYHI